MRGKALFNLILAALCFVVLFLSYKFAYFWLSPVKSVDQGPQKFIFYEVKPKETLIKLSNDLEEQGIVSSGRMFYWYARITGKAKKFKAADYRFSNRMRPDDVISMIQSGIPYGFPLIVPEGYSMYQVAELIENFRPGAGERFLKLCNSRKYIRALEESGLFSKQTVSAMRSLEGYLFPDTYLLGRKITEDEIIRRMVKKYRQVYTPELEIKAHSMGMTEHQIVTLASIIEKETGAKSERPIISSVFHNRLKKKMRLQTDPTVIYGIKNFNGNITRKDLDTYTPYNTYKINGLPPGPIANPGKEAILAALYPAETNYLYFVSHNNGTHEFTSTYADHLKAVAKFQLNQKAREGKSWRNLKQ